MMVGDSVGLNVGDIVVTCTVTDFDESRVRVLYPMRYAVDDKPQSIWVCREDLIPLQSEDTAKDGGTD